MFEERNNQELRGTGLLLNTFWLRETGQKALPMECLLNGSAYAYGVELATTIRSERTEKWLDKLLRISDT